VNADANPVFTVRSETGWREPSGKAVRRSWFRTAAEIVNAASSGSSPSTPDWARGEPQWRAVLFDGQTPIATSRWRTDWAHVEKLIEDWSTRLAKMPAGEVRSQAHKWNVE